MKNLGNVKLGRVIVFRCEPTIQVSLRSLDFAAQYFSLYRSLATMCPLGKIDILIVLSRVGVAFFPDLRPPGACYCLP